ncbi:MAG: glycosyltransferase [Paludibacteraceae bacterium]|nr:glycosyltransferase [Paludibacteraceae bacterium]
MNLIYVTDNYVNPLSGGIARISHVMAEALAKQYGHICYSVYANPAPQNTPATTFIETHHWQNKDDFCSWINRIGGGIVIVQSPCTLSQDIFDCVPLLSSIKVVNVFHGTPGFEIVPLRWDIIRYRLCHNIDTRWTLKQAVLQLAMTVFPKSYFLKKLRPKYARPYGKTHKIVVLSQKTINNYLSIASGQASDFVAIPNANSFDKVEIPHDKYRNKEVLVVARLDDWHKRISEILYIWADLQKDHRFCDWVLRIVGDGIDAPFYKDFVKNKKLTNLIFEGQQKPLPYYRQASIFLVTSACEGFPMTILESQQCGCVPIVYDSFAAATDLIADGSNGILIENNNRTAFAKELQRLMLDDQLRKDMSINCVELSSRFSVENVANLWNNLLQSV